jgi:hypothetical protein
LFTACESDPRVAYSDVSHYLSPEAGVNTYREFDPYFAHYSSWAADRELLHRITNRTTEAEIANLLAPQEIILPSAARSVSINGEEYAFIPIASPSQPILKDYMYLPLNQSGAIGRYSHEFDSNLGLNDFFKREILRGLTAARKPYVPSFGAMVIDSSKSPIQPKYNCYIVNWVETNTYYISDELGEFTRLDYIAQYYTSELICDFSTSAWQVGHTYQLSWAPTGAGSGGTSRTPQQSGNIGVAVEDLCIDAIDDLYYNDFSLSNDFEIKLNDFAFEFAFTQSDGRTIFPVIRFNNVMLSADNVYAGGQNALAPYGYGVAKGFERVIERSLQEAEGQIYNHGLQDNIVPQIESALKGFFQDALLNHLQTETTFGGATNFQAAANNTYSTSSTRTTWDPDCR